MPAMEQAAADLLGPRDFRAFCGNKHMKKSTVRTLRSIDIVRTGPELQFRFTGDGFLYHMVRILTGTLLEVGLGRRPADSMPALLESLDRSQAGFLAPPQGLFLESVAY